MIDIMLWRLYLQTLPRYSLCYYSHGYQIISIIIFESSDER